MEKERYIAPLIKGVQLESERPISSSPFSGGIEQPSLADDNNFFESTSVEGTESY